MNSSVILNGSIQSGFQKILLYCEKPAMTYKRLVYKAFSTLCYLKQNAVITHAMSRRFFVASSVLVYITYKGIALDRIMEDTICTVSVRWDLRVAITRSCICIIKKWQLDYWTEESLFADIDWRRAMEYLRLRLKQDGKVKKPLLQTAVEGREKHWK